MPTRRSFHIGMLSIGAVAFPWHASGQQDDTVAVSIRADDSVRAGIPPIVEASLNISPDQSVEAQDLARRSPSNRAVPVILIIVGAIAVTDLLQMIRELIRQTYYGGELIATRPQPAIVTSDPKIPASTVFVIDADGKTNRFTTDQFSLDVLKLALKAK